MDYYDVMKLKTVRSNLFLFLVSLVGLILCIFFFWKWKKKLDEKGSWVTDFVLGFLFVLLFFANVRITKEIAFKIPWDVGVVSSFAYRIADRIALEYEYYLSQYPNNIHITYLLGRLYRFANEMDHYPYEPDFFWLQVNCALISLGGYFSCLTVKKVTKRLAPTALCFLVYLVLVGVSPWKIAPYTDTYGLVFPVMAIYFYLCYREAGRVWLRSVWLLLSLFCGMAGGFIKPSVYLVVIAIVGVEVLHFLEDWKAYWKYLASAVLFLLLLWVGGKGYTNHIIEEIGLDYNAEIEASWHHYFYMGLNEKTTGSYDSDCAAIFGEFQFDKEQRRKAQIERAFAWIKERGVGGSLSFYLRKMVMTFNDGTFGWQSEVWPSGFYEPDLSTNTALTQLCRDIFWQDSRYTGRYNTICQLLWIFCMLGIPGICIWKSGSCDRMQIFIICFLGIFFYQMLFEARARYLFVFLPVLVATSSIGFWQYATWLEEVSTGWRKWWPGRKSR